MAKLDEHWCKDGRESGNIQGGFRKHSGNIQGTFREYSGNAQRPFKDHSGNLSEMMAFSPLSDIAKQDEHWCEDCRESVE
jgi:hypothetical protein